MDKLRYTSDSNLPTLVAKLALLKREGEYWDFKREWHSNNADLLHDIICLANNPTGETGLLIIGIDEDAGFAPTVSEKGLGDRKNTQTLTNFLRDKQWSNGFPSVRVAQISIFGASVDVVLIAHEEDAVPYYLTKDYGSGKKTVRAGTIYARDADNNTPKNGVASSLAVERLWRRHFGLDKTPLERLPHLLKDPSKWKCTLPVQPRGEEASGYCYYCVDYPEFTYVRSPEPELDGYRYFMLASPFFRSPDWWIGRFYYHQTMIFEMPGAYSDKLWIPVPATSHLHASDAGSFDVEKAHYYGYYIKDSIERVAMMFELDESKEGPSASNELERLDLLVPVFNDEQEREQFECWIEGDWSLFLSSCDKQERAYRVPAEPEDPPGRFKLIERWAKESATLVDLLERYRSIDEDSLDE